MNSIPTKFNASYFIKQLFSGALAKLIFRQKNTGMLHKCKGYENVRTNLNNNMTVLLKINMFIFT